MKRTRRPNVGDFIIEAVPESRAPQVQHDASCASYQPPYRCPTCVRNYLRDLYAAVQKLNGNYWVGLNYGGKLNVTIHMEDFEELRDLAKLAVREYPPAEPNAHIHQDYCAPECPMWGTDWHRP